MYDTQRVSGQIKLMLVDSGTRVSLLSSQRLHCFNMWRGNRFATAKVFSIRWPWNGPHPDGRIVKLDCHTSVCSCADWWFYLRVLYHYEFSKIYAESVIKVNGLSRICQFCHVMSHKWGCLFLSFSTRCHCSQSVWRMVWILGRAVPLFFGISGYCRGIYKSAFQRGVI